MRPRAPGRVRGRSPCRLCDACRRSCCCRARCAWSAAVAAAALVAAAEVAAASSKSSASVDDCRIGCGAPRISAICDGCRVFCPEGERTGARDEVLSASGGSSELLSAASASSAAAAGFSAPARRARCEHIQDSASVCVTTRTACRRRARPRSNTYASPSVDADQRGDDQHSDSGHERGQHERSGQWPQARRLRTAATRRARGRRGCGRGCLSNRERGIESHAVAHKHAGEHARMHRPHTTEDTHRDVAAVKLTTLLPVIGSALTRSPNCASAVEVTAPLYSGELGLASCAPRR